MKTKTNNCPICKCKYSKKKKAYKQNKSHHHVLPKRYFNGKGSLVECCRGCHDEIEELIRIAETKNGKRVKLSIVEYKNIVDNFLQKRGK